jgi:hypothetical protein
MKMTSEFDMDSMAPGFEVVDNADLTAFTIHVEGRPLH